MAITCSANCTGESRVLCSSKMVETSQKKREGERRKKRENKGNRGKDIEEMPKWKKAKPLDSSVAVGKTRGSFVEKIK